MEMTDLLPLAEWQRLERELHKRFGLNGCVYDAKGYTFTGSSPRGVELCTRLRATERGIGGICAPAHQNIAAMAREAREPVVEVCDAGLLKICVPVFVGQELVGVIGACGGLGPDGEIDGFLIEKTCGVAEAEVEALTPTAPAMDQATIDAAVDLMTSWAAKAGAARAAG